MWNLSGLNRLNFKFRLSVNGYNYSVDYFLGGSVVDSNAFGYYILWNGGIAPPYYYDDSPSLHNGEVVSVEVSFLSSNLKGYKFAKDLYNVVPVTSMTFDPVSQNVYFVDAKNVLYAVS